VEDRYMRKNKDIVDSYNEKNSSFKIYEMKANYVSFLNKESLNFLMELKGKIINNIPFVNSFFKAGTCKLEDVEVEEDYIFYRLDFQNEKIVYESSIPIRVMKHQRVEFIHYYKLNVGCVYENEAIDSVKVLSIGMMLAYWALIGSYITKNVPYGKPVIEGFTMDLSESLGFFEDYLLRYIKCESNDFGDKLVIMENWWEGEVSGKGYEAKMLRKNNIKYSINLPNGDKPSVIFTNNGQVKSRIPLSLELIKKYIHMIEFIKMNPNIICESFNILNILEEWISYISEDMYEEYKIKKKIAVIQDLKNIIKEALKNERDESNNCDDILKLSLIFRELLFICKMDKEELKDKISIDVIEYDSLCIFLKWYMKEKNSVYAKDMDLENILQKFYLYIKEIY
jgi:hypothetical protein